MAATLTGRIEKNRRVVGAQGIGRALGQAAQEDPRVQLAGQAGERLSQWTGHARRGLAESDQRATILEHFGEGHQARVLLAGLPDEGGGAVDVGSNVLIGGQLDEGDPEFAHPHSAPVW